MITNEQRDKVVEVARTWLGTKYHHMGRKKGAGVDCATFLCEVYEEAGIIEHVDLEYYPMDWHIHRATPRYLQQLLQYVERTDKPQRGDIAMFKFGKCAAHGAIVVAWPIIIHSYFGRAVEMGDANTMQPQFFGWFTPKGGPK